MQRRQTLNSELEALLGSCHVYFQPPESVKMHYPCIVYELNSNRIVHANNKKYNKMNQYSFTVIDYTPDSEIPDKILSHFQYCSLGRPFASDNLNHFPGTLYY